MIENGNNGSLYTDKSVPKIEYIEKIIAQLGYPIEVPKFPKIMKDGKKEGFARILMEWKGDADDIRRAKETGIGPMSLVNQQF